MTPREEPFGSGAAHQPRSTVIQPRQAPREEADMASVRTAGSTDVTLAQANGIEIAYETFGAPTGRPLVLVMGAGVQMLG
jgi:hypothetical protein